MTRVLALAAALAATAAFRAAHVTVWAGPDATWCATLHAGPCADPAFWVAAGPPSWWATFAFGALVGVVAWTVGELAAGRSKP